MTDQFYTWLLLFFAYSLIGWCCEVVYCSLLDHRFVNRGFLSGPICPIYGAGALAVIALLTPVAAYIPLVFLCGMVVTSAIEYLTSWGMEKLFHARWWDYSDRKWNWNGRICLGNSCLFGLLSLVLMYGIHPLLLKLLGRLPPPITSLLATVLLIVLVVDLCTTVQSVLNLNQRLERMRRTLTELKQRLGEGEWTAEYPSLEKLQHWREHLKTNSGEKKALGEHLLADLQALRQENGYHHRRLLRAFPRWRSQRYPQYLAAIRAELEKMRRIQQEKKGKKENQKGC